MRARCVVVPKDQGERVRAILKERGLLLKHLRIRSEGDRLCLPVSERADLGFPVEEREFEEGFSPVRSYRDLAEVPADVRSALPRAFDVVGDIAIVRLPPGLEAHGAEVARAILRWNRRIRVVARDRGVGGERRVRSIEILGGEARTTTVHVEHGLRYRVDLAQAYFSPRLATERERIAGLVRAGEVVADPFAGVGPYAILIARRSAPKAVIASDANPRAVELLRANVAANRAERVHVRAAEAREALAEARPLDRVILDLPLTARDFLPDAVRAIHGRGVVHLYRILERAAEPDELDAIRRVVREEGGSIVDVARHRVRAYGPTEHHVAFDVTVARG